MILLLHGALGGASQMEPVRTLLPGHDVHTMDFFGHGARAGEVLSGEDFGIPRFAQNVLEWMDERSIPQTDFFGYSMGGYVAFYLAKTHPARVGKVATLGTKFLWSPEYARQQQQMLDAETIRNKVPKFAAALAARHGEAHWARVLAQTAAMMQDLGAKPLLDAAAFGALPQPALLMVGGEDNTVSEDETMEVARLMPDARMGLLPGTPHPLERAVDTVLFGNLLYNFFSA